MTSIGVFAAIFNAEDCVLCVQHNYGLKDWGMPGGALESGEDPIEAVKREVDEESGVIASIDELCGVYSAPHNDDLVLLFIGHAVGRDSWLPNGEIAACDYFGINEFAVTDGTECQNSIP